VFLLHSSLREVRVLVQIYLARVRGRFPDPDALKRLPELKDSDTRNADVGTENAEDTEPREILRYLCMCSLGVDLVGTYAICRLH
jgi:hypothetical protein